MGEILTQTTGVASWKFALLLKTLAPMKIALRLLFLQPLEGNTLRRHWIPTSTSAVLQLPRPLTSEEAKHLKGSRILKAALKYHKTCPVLWSIIQAAPLIWFRSKHSQKQVNALKKIRLFLFYEIKTGTNFSCRGASIKEKQNRDLYRLILSLLTSVNLHSGTNSKPLHLTLLLDRKSSSLQLRVLEYKERAGSVDKIV